MGKKLNIKELLNIHIASKERKKEIDIEKLKEWFGDKWRTEGIKEFERKIELENETFDEFFGDRYFK